MNAAKAKTAGTRRIPLLPREEMTPAQREVYDAVVSGPRGQMIGPLTAAIHVPELAAIWSSFGEYLRYRTGLPAKLKELAIIATGRRWTSQLEWWAHSALAAQAGLSAAAIQAIKERRPPRFDEEAELEVYEFARQLLDLGEVDDQTYEAVRDRWGVTGVVELAALVGYYTLVAMTLNAHRIPAPEGDPPLGAAPGPPSPLGPGCMGPKT